MKNQKLNNLVKKLYKNDDGEPFVLTEGQQEIFNAIATRRWPRVEVRTYTQFGKSDTTALGILTRITSHPEKYTVISGSDKKLGIIRSYLIGHIFDNEFTLACFDINKGESLERIRRERNKNRLTFRVGDRISEVMFISAEGRRVKDTVNTLLGFGSPNIIIDDSPLLSDDHYAGIIRMMGGHKDNMLIELGNAVDRNHFYRCSRDPSYKHIVIDYEQGIAEGRQTVEFFDEMRRKMSKQLFESLYECKFPAADAIDSQGYSALIIEEDLDRAYLDDLDLFGELRLGVDVAGGGKNYSVVVLKGNNGAKILFRENINDTMVLVGIILKLMAEHKVLMDNIFIDTVGIGKGVYDRLCEVKSLDNTIPNAVSFGEKASDEDNFMNLRAECYWNTVDWLRNGAKLKRNVNWDELLKVKYKIQSDRKIKIMPKEEMLKQGIESPDAADALALCFAKSQNTANWRQQEQFAINETNFYKDNLE